MVWERVVGYCVGWHGILSSAWFIVGELGMVYGVVECREVWWSATWCKESSQCQCVSLYGSARDVFSHGRKDSSAVASILHLGHAGLTGFGWGGDHHSYVLKALWRSSEECFRSNKPVWPHRHCCWSRRGAGAAYWWRAQALVWCCDRDAAPTSGRRYPHTPTLQHNNLSGASNPLYAATSETM